MAAGNAAMYVMLMSTVTRWFDRRRGLALGIAGAGLGLGPAVAAPAATFLIGRLGWRSAYTVLGVAVWAVVLPASLLLKRPPPGIGGTLPGQPPAGLSARQALRTGSFWMLLSIWLCFATTLVLVLTHLVTDAAGFYLFAVVFDLAWGGINPGMAALIGDSFGLASIGTIFGLVDIGWALGSAVGPMIGGLSFDATDSYLTAFVVAAVVMVVAAGLTLPIRLETASRAD